MLTMNKDGVNGFDLGVIGEWQYALSYCGRLKSDIYRRKASEAGTYGGWRFEFGSTHPRQYQALPGMAELWKRIEAAPMGTPGAHNAN